MDPHTLLPLHSATRGCWPAVTYLERLAKLGEVNGWAVLNSHNLILLVILICAAILRAAVLRRCKSAHLLLQLLLDVHLDGYRSCCTLMLACKYWRSQEFLCERCMKGWLLS